MLATPPRQLPIKTHVPALLLPAQHNNAPHKGSQHGRKYSKTGRHFHTHMALKIMQKQTYKARETRTGSIKRARKYGKEEKSMKNNKKTAEKICR